MKKRHIYRTISLVSAAVLAALLFCEVSVRLVYKGRYAKRPNFYVTDPILGYRPAADLDDEFFGADFSIDVVTDPDGYRLGSLGRVDPEKEIVLFCGDSYVFGWGVSTDETCASYLDGMLGEASDGSARLVNLGVGGYGTWQTAFRLERFLEKYPDMKIAAAVFVHVPNDPCDNAKAIGYPLRVRRTEERKPRHRTPSHLVNMATGFYRSIRRKKSESEFRGRKTERMEAVLSRPGNEDVLFAFDDIVSGAPMPDEAVFGGRRIDIRGLSRPDDMIEILLIRENMTRIQRDLLREGVNYTHDLLREKGIKIFHIVLPTSPDWFASEMADILGRTVPSDWNEIVMAGKYPDISGFDGEAFNTHSGGHYTAEFNLFWARRIMELIDANTVGSWADQ